MSSLQRLTGKTSKRQYRRNLWFERVMALLALLNLLLVLFDISYIPLRNFWLQRKVQVFSFKVGPLESQGFPVSFKWLIPDVTRFYDPVKGIVPYRDTQQYLERVDQLQNELIDPGLRSPEVAAIFADLRDRSIEIIDTNPFQIANKTGTLEKIKNKMRERVPNQEDSAKEAFNIFWSQDYLASDPVQKLNFFNNEIRPLIETNYYRPIGENGEFVDLFGLIDFPFFVLFGVEFLARTWLISRRRTGVSWLDAMLWRWYDILLLIPLWRWLRIIPVTIRLDQAKLIDLSRIENQIRQGFVAEIAEDMTQVVVIRVINEAQSSIRKGEIAKWLSQQETRPYVDLNDINEVAEITSIMSQLMVYQVLPKIRPDLEALLEHYLEKVLNQAPIYQGLEQVPGLGDLRNQLTGRLVTEITQAVYDGLNSALEKDPVADQLFQRLLAHFSEAFGAEIQGKRTLQEIQSLLTALLEEVKVNYVERLSEEDFEAILDQTRAIRQTAHK